MNEFLQSYVEQQREIWKKADLFVKTFGLPDGYVLVESNEYQDLKEESDFLKALQAAGVDNWEGYDAAWEAYKDSE